MKPRHLAILAIVLLAALFAGLHALDAAVQSMVADLGRGFL
jgi:hypothetical protein